MYIVRFVRVDSKPNEDYYYVDPNEALSHLKKFKQDDSGLYTKVQLVVEEEVEIVVTEITFE